MANEMTQKDSQVIQSNCNDYKSWSSDDATQWIISVDESKFEQYRQALNNSFKNNPFNIELITDHQDLEKYGITDLDDRKTIYKAITELIATQRSSTDTQTIDTQDKEIKTSELSTSGDEEENESETHYSQSAQSSLFSDADDEKKSTDEDDSKFNLELQRENLINNGYCKWPYNKSYREIMVCLTSGYVRIYYEGNHKMSQDIYKVIREFYGMTLALGEEIRLKLKSHLYISTINNISLSKVLSTSLEASDSNEIIVDGSEIAPEPFEHALMYLGHHKGVEPDPLPCPVRSIHMRQICSDRWDADWIDVFDKKTLFEIVLVANNLDIKPLLHLGCAKIATLIKQLDQKEINRIIEEEEKYRREHANNNNNNDTNGSEDEEDQKRQQTLPTAPSIAMLDELVTIFDHDYTEQIEYNEEEDEDEDEEENEVRIQGIDNEEDKVEKGIAEKSNNTLMNPTVVILDELLLAFDYQ